MKILILNIYKNLISPFILNNIEVYYSIAYLAYIYILFTLSFSNAYSTLKWIVPFIHLKIIFLTDIGEKLLFYFHLQYFTFHPIFKINNLSKCASITYVFKKYLLANETVSWKCVDDFLEFGMDTSLRQFGYWKRKRNGLAHRMKNEPRNNTKSAKWIKRARGSLFSRTMAISATFARN